MKEETKKPILPEIGKKETKKENVKIDLKEILNDPITKMFFGGCKDLFKKEKPDPNICEITIKAPSEVVLKLFKTE